MLARGWMWHPDASWPLLSGGLGVTVFDVVQGQEPQQRDEGLDPAVLGGSGYVDGSGTTHVC